MAHMNNSRVYISVRQEEEEDSNKHDGDRTSYDMMCYECGQQLLTTDEVCACEENPIHTETNTFMDWCIIQCRACWCWCV